MVRIAARDDTKTSSGNSHLRTAWQHHLPKAQALRHVLGFGFRLRAYSTMGLAEFVKEVLCLASDSGKVHFQGPGVSIHDQTAKPEGKDLNSALPLFVGHTVEPEILRRHMAKKGLVCFWFKVGGCSPKHSPSLQEFTWSPRYAAPLGVRHRSFLRKDPYSGARTVIVEGLSVGSEQLRSILASSAEHI